MDEKKEKKFDEWIESISFVDSEGKLLPVELKEDESEDPEEDRG